MYVLDLQGAHVSNLSLSLVGISDQVLGFIDFVRLVFLTAVGL